jgi:ATPase family associated with various cellular activities (AAA)
MSKEAWLDANNHYLATSLEWLRLRLKRLAQTEGQSSELADQIEQSAARRAEAAQIKPPPALILLAQKFGLSEFERDTLLLCAAVEFDPALGSLYARAHGNSSLKFPTFGLALAALDEPRWDALAPHRPSRFWRLIEVNPDGATPLTSSPLRSDERIVNFIKGLNLIDERIANLLLPSDSESVVALSPSQETVADSIVQKLQASDLTLVQLVGSDAVSKQSVAAQVSAALDRQLYRLGIDALPSTSAELETLARLWQRESALLPIALYLEAENADRTLPEGAGSLRRFLGRETGLVFIGVRDTPLQLDRANLTADVAKPNAAEQRAAWRAILQEDGDETEADGNAQRLAGQFDLNLREIGQAARAGCSSQSAEQKLWRACRELTRPRLDLLAQRLEPKATWDELVLPNEQLDLLHRIAGQVRDRHRVYEDWGFSARMNRGYGISALFTGESGTGKTMSAEVIANELRLNLYRIDLSAVVSKYIGETEKNLRRLFDAAENGGAILFFDEADALFGKRSEVKDSHDRYANIEINYLLQRMESFGGLAILATNMKTALDGAFLRRLRFVVNFQFPGAPERKLIWQKALPSETPKAELDYDRLARLNLAGGNIHSIALNAAFMAAQNGQTVTMPILLASARMEFRKLEKPVPEAEFR